MDNSHLCCLFSFYRSDCWFGLFPYPMADRLRFMKKLVKEYLR